MITIVRAHDYNDMSRKVANIISAQIILKPNCVLGLATGSTPIGAYQQLVEWYKKGDLDFSQVSSYNLDEYRGLAGDHPQSYRYFMNTNLFDHVNIDKSKTFVPDGMAEDYEAACAAYDAAVAAAGYPDLQLLGIGNNGHIGFNEPLTPFTSVTHIVKLTDSTREANKRFFSSLDEVPTHAVTMGIHTVMKARSIILLAFGEAKADIIKKTVEGRPDIAVPASLLQLHEDVTLYLDHAAAAKLS